MTKTKDKLYMDMQVYQFGNKEASKRFAEIMCSIEAVKIGVFFIIK